MARHITEKKYVFVFTDDAHPQNIIQQLKKKILYTNVIFEARSKNHHSKNVVEDFTAMMRFDYLIGPDSAVSALAGMFGHHKKVISPALEYYKLKWHS